MKAALTRVAIGLAVGLITLPACSGCARLAATGAGIPGDYVGDSAFGEVYVVRGHETQWVELRGVKTEKLASCYDAAVLPDGDLLLSSTNEGFVLRTADGASRELMAANSLAGSIWLDGTGRWVAFSWPLKWDGWQIVQRGVGVYDLVTHQSRLLLSDPGRDTRIFGWLGKRIVFSWSSETTPPFQTVDLEGREQTLTTRPSNLNRFGRMRDALLPFETTDGSLGVLDFATLEIRYVAGATQAHWVKAGLEALRGERWEIVVEAGSE